MSWWEFVALAIGLSLIVGPSKFKPWYWRLGFVCLMLVAILVFFYVQTHTQG